MNDSWLESKAYWTHVASMRASIMRDAMTATTEAQTEEAFQKQLYYYIRMNTGVELSFRPETPIREGLVHNFGVLKDRTSGRGRLDAVVNNLLIEYKKHKKLEKEADQQTAIHQVKDYLQTLYENEKVQYSAILTDGVQISYFGFRGNTIESTQLKAMEDEDIDRIIRAILTNNSKKLISENIYKDFSVDGLTESLSRTLANVLYEKLCNAPTEKTQMLFSEWESLMHLSYDDSGKGNDIQKRRSDLSLIFGDHIAQPKREYKALFALQTTFAIIVKLIACKVIDKLDGTTTRFYSDLTSVTSTELQAFLENLEDGYVYRSNNILNLLEGDFFSWYSTKEQWDGDLWSSIKEIIACIDRYSSFSFDISYQPVDVFKDLYMGIIPKSVRHSMGEYFTPEWLADYVISEGIKLHSEENWKAIDPCCGSGTFLISLIKHIVGHVELYALSEDEKDAIRNRILNSVYGIDINPLSVLAARVGYYFALRPFGEVKDVEIPVYLGDSAIVPVKETIGGIECYKYSVANNKKPLDVILPVRFVQQKEFGELMASLQAAVELGDEAVLFAMIYKNLSAEETESEPLLRNLKKLATDLIELHKGNWDGIWIRIATNYMLIARLARFDLIIGNPPWVKWEHLPSKYAERIKELCNVKHIFSTRGRFGGTQLNICALISNVAATNWLKKDGVLAFLMPDSIMSQNSYEEYRYFYTDFEKNERLYLQKIDKWEKPLRPFMNEDLAVSQDFNTYYFAYRQTDYSKGIDVITISRNKGISDAKLNKQQSFADVKDHLVFGNKKAAQLSKRSSAFSYLSESYDFSKIIGPSGYEYRTGVEFTPQELYMLVGMGASKRTGHYRFQNKKFSRSKYIVHDMPQTGWDLPTEYVFPIATGPSLTPFHCAAENEFCILPYSVADTTAPVGIEKMISGNNELFLYLLNHQALIESQSEKSKELRRGDEFYALSKIGPYTFGNYIVAARDNTKFCSSVIEPSITPWGEIKPTVCVKHTIVISRDTGGRFIGKEEAHYINGILNCDVVISYIQSTFKSNGYSLKKSNLYLPLYDASDETHQRISRLSLIATKASDAGEIKKIQSEISALYLKLCSRK